MLKGFDTGYLPKQVFDREAKQIKKSTDLENSTADPFTALSAEIISMVVEHLSSKDITNLRLATRAIRQLSAILFRRLLLEDMTWMSEAEDVPVRKVDWHRLYCVIKFGWVGLKGLRNRKRIWKDVEEIVRRIGKYRSERKISGLKQ